MRHVALFAKKDTDVYFLGVFNLFELAQNEFNRWVTNNHMEDCKPIYRDCIINEIAKRNTITL